MDTQNNDLLVFLVNYSDFDPRKIFTNNSLRPIFKRV